MAHWFRNNGQKFVRTGTLKWLLLGSLIGLISGVASFLLYLGIDVTSGLLLKGVMDTNQVPRLANNISASCPPRKPPILGSLC